MKLQTHHTERANRNSIRPTMTWPLAKAAAIFLALSAVVLMTGTARSSSPQQQPATPAEWKAVEQAIGKAGAMQAGDVFKFSFPRSDLKVTVRGVAIKPALALGAWIAFKKMGDDTMVMGDLVLTEDEVSPVMFKLQQGGIEQSALHNHVLGESPRVMYMHISAHGRAAGLAETLGRVMEMIGTPMNAPAASAPSQNLEIDTKQ